MKLVMFRAIIRTLATHYNNLTHQKSNPTEEVNSYISRRNTAVLRMTHSRAQNAAKSSINHINGSEWYLRVDDTSEPLLMFSVKHTPQHALASVQVPSPQLWAKLPIPEGPHSALRCETS